MESGDAEVSKAGALVGGFYFLKKEMFQGCSIRKQSLWGLGREGAKAELRKGQALACFSEAEDNATVLLICSVLGKKYKAQGKIRESLPFSPLPR